MDKHTEEYKLLKQEIVNNNNILRNFQLALYSSVGVILTLAFSQQEPIICLIPFFVIIPLYLLRMKQSSDIIRTGAYMQVFLEGEAFNWETRLHEYGKLINDKKVIKLDFILLCVTSFVLLLTKLSISDFSRTECIFRVALGSVSLVMCLIVMMVYKINPVEEKEKHIRNWKLIMHQEEENKELDKECRQMFSILYKMN